MRSITRIALVLVCLAALTLIAFSLQIPAAGTDQAPPSSARAAALVGVVRASANLEAPPPPAEDTCQHCHLSGSIKDLFYPLGRWLVFGAFGFAFVYGTFRMGSAWVTHRPWKPIPARTVDWVDDRLHVKEPLTKALAKPVPGFARMWWYCLGGLTFALFVVLAITGIMLAFYYKPTPAEAYASIQFIETQVRFGSAIRAIHHWAANGMVVLVVAHMLRVFITGAFKPPRELNWVTGVVLLVVTLGFGFTGYLLPWDQTAFWASTVGTEIAGAEPAIGNLALIFLRGGWEVGAQTLSRFYGLHVIVLPILILVLLGGHFLMIRRQGIAKPL